RDQRRLAVTHAISLHQGEERSVFTSPRGRRAAVVSLGGVLGDEGLSGLTLTGGTEATTSVASAHRVLDRALTDPLTRGVLLDLALQVRLSQLQRRLDAARRPRGDRAQPRHVAGAVRGRGGQGPSHGSGTPAHRARRPRVADARVAAGGPGRLDRLPGGRAA